MALGRGVIALGLSVAGHLAWLSAQPDIVAPQKMGVVGQQPLAIAIVQIQAPQVKAFKPKPKPKVEKPKPVTTKAVIKSPVEKPKPQSIEPALKQEQVIAKARAEPEVEEQPVQLKPQSLPVVKEARFRAPPQSPVYPRLALRRRQQGEAWVKALVNARGETQQVKLSRSSGFDSLDRSALAAVSKWLFAAAQIDGKPVTAWVEVPVDFVIN
ncbi:MAG: energy transducer TonB [Algicola sp.]|nr:energy transducer TonB [Algicola sp.]